MSEEIIHKCSCNNRYSSWEDSSCPECNTPMISDIEIQGLKAEVKKLTDHYLTKDKAHQALLRLYNDKSSEVKVLDSIIDKFNRGEITRIQRT